MRAGISSAATLFLVFGLATTTWADAITITADRRATIVLANTADAKGSDRHTATNGPGDAITSTASASTGTSSGVSTGVLTSSIADPMHWTGSGTADVAWSTQGMADYSALAQFGIDFTLTSAVNFLFDGSFAGAASNTGVPLVSSSQSRWDVNLFSLTGGPAVFGDSGISTTATRTFSGLLGPGQYRLLLLAGSIGGNYRDGGAGSTHTQFAFNFDLAPSEPVSATPEPASLLLMGTGIAGLCASARRKGRQAR